MLIIMIIVSIIFYTTEVHSRILGTSSYHFTAIDSLYFITKCKKLVNDTTHQWIVLTRVKLLLWCTLMWV